MLFYVWKVEIDVYSICIIFKCQVGVQNTGVRICWENRCQSSAATGSARIILKKTSLCILTRRASRTPKLMKVTHTCKSLAIWLQTKTVQHTLDEDCMLIIKPVSIDPNTNLAYVWCDWEFSPLLIHFATTDTSILHTDDLVFTLWVMFSLKVFASLRSQYIHF